LISFATLNSSDQSRIHICSPAKAGIQAL